jgi:hypothetical protein
MFLFEFGKEHLGNRLISGRRELHVQQAVRRGIDRSVQLEPFVMELAHGFIHRDVSRGGHHLWAVTRPSAASCGQWIDSARHPNYK